MILVDGLDISSLRRESIRTGVVAIPQDAFVLSHSIRFNIDPSGVSSDEEIISALEKVKLWDIIQCRIDSAAVQAYSGTSTQSDGSDDDTSCAGAKSSSDVLDSPLKQSPLSHGQFHLLGLARAIILKARSKILLLDEATSNVDAATEEIMQQVVKEEFTDYTVITIAHRLNTIRDADTVVVMDNGRIVEFGSPDRLLAKNAVTQSAIQSESDCHQSQARAWFREMWDSAHLNDSE